MKKQQIFRYSVNVKGEYRKRIGKAEQENLDFNIKGLIIEGPENEKLLPPIIRDACLPYIREHIEPRATAIRLFFPEKITRLGLASNPVENATKNLDDMSATELREFARDNDIDIPPNLTKGVELLDHIIREVEKTTGTIYNPEAGKAKTQQDEGNGGDSDDEESEDDDGEGDEDEEEIEEGDTSDLDDDFAGGAR